MCAFGVRPRGVARAAEQDILACGRTTRPELLEAVVCVYGRAMMLPDESFTVETTQPEIWKQSGVCVYCRAMV